MLVTGSGRAFSAGGDLKTYVSLQRDPVRFPHFVADLHAACMNHALYLARQEGFDWLAILDPDEFAFANNPGRSAIERAHLPAMLRRIATTTAAVRLPTREIGRGEYGWPPAGKTGRSRVGSHRPRFRNPWRWDGDNPS